MRESMRGCKVVEAHMCEPTEFLRKNVERKSVFLTREDITGKLRLKEHW